MLPPVGWVQVTRRLRNLQISTTFATRPENHQVNSGAGVYYRSLSATSYVTNDTDLIYSDTSTLLTNDLALNVAMTNALSLRTSLATSFDDSVDDTFGDASNTLGVAVVYNFN